MNAYLNVFIWMKILAITFSKNKALFQYFLNCIK